MVILVPDKILLLIYLFIYLIIFISIFNVGIFELYDHSMLDPKIKVFLAMQDMTKTDIEEERINLSVCIGWRSMSRWTKPVGSVK